LESDPQLFVAFNDMLNVPDVDGTPEITPVLGVVVAKDNPLGRFDTDNVLVADVDEAVSVYENACPTVAEAVRDEVI
jgi:hypothetical protein